MENDKKIFSVKIILSYGKKIYRWENIGREKNITIKNYH